MKHLDIKSSIASTVSKTFDCLLYNADLTAAFTALVLAANGKKVCLIYQTENIFANARYVRFVEQSPYTGYIDKDNFPVKQLFKAATIINSIAPNTFYKNECYAFVKKMKPIDFLLSMAKRSSNNVKKADSIKNKIFSNSQYSLEENYIAQTSPAYRFCESRFLAALFRTLEDLGSVVIKCSECVGQYNGVYNFVYKNNVNFSVKALKIKNFANLGMLTQKRVFLKTSMQRSPVAKPVFITDDGICLYLFPHFSELRIAAFLFSYSEGTTATSSELTCFTEMLNETIDGATIEARDFTVQSVSVTCAHENPCKSILLAEKNTLALFPDIIKPLDALNDFSLRGCKFDIPTPLGIVDYADTKFDEVKRLGVDVDQFKVAVFDFGTEIDDIINRTYELYPQSGSGIKAFADAVLQYRADNEG